MHFLKDVESHVRLVSQKSAQFNCKLVFDDVEETLRSEHRVELQSAATRESGRGSALAIRVKVPKRQALNNPLLLRVRISPHLEKVHNFNHLLVFEGIREQLAELGLYIESAEKTVSGRDSDLAIRVKI